ncbi:MAG: hypothetical protein WB677_05720, partial [Xanthobacteraceae bacterium]
TILTMIVFLLESIHVRHYGILASRQQTLLSSLSGKPFRQSLLGKNPSARAIVTGKGKLLFLDAAVNRLHATAQSIRDFLNGQHSIRVRRCGLRRHGLLGLGQ